MAQPTASEVHVDSILTNISVAYAQSADAFIASKVFPVVSVEKQSDKYFKFNKEDWFRDEAEKRADGDESAGSGYGLSTDSYSCEVYAFHKDVSDRVRKNADNPLKPDEDAVRFVTQRMLLRQEIQWVSDYFTTGVWSVDSTPSVTWDDVTSDPINDIEAGKESVLSKTGFEPRTLVMGYQVFRQLKNHPDIIDRIKYTSAQTVTPELLARLFDIDRVMIARAIKNTAKEGQTAAYSFAHGKHALLCHVAPSPGLLTPSAGYTFMWNGVSDGLGENIGISRIRMDARKSDRIEAEIAYVNKVVASDLGYFFNGAVA
jgi:hypothetical protein